MTGITGTLHEDQCTFMIIPRWILLKMRNICLRQNCSENQTTHFMFNKFFFRKSRRFFEIILTDLVEPDGPQITIWRRPEKIFACLMTKARIQTHSWQLCLLSHNWLIPSDFVKCLTQHLKKRINDLLVITTCLSKLHAERRLWAHQHSVSERSVARFVRTPPYVQL